MFNFSNATYLIKHPYKTKNTPKNNCHIMMMNYMHSTTSKEADPAAKDYAMSYAAAVEART